MPKRRPKKQPGRKPMLDIPAIIHARTVGDPVKGKLPDRDLARILWEATDAGALPSVHSLKDDPMEARRHRLFHQFGLDEKKYPKPERGKDGKPNMTGSFAELVEEREKAGQPYVGASEGLPRETDREPSGEARSRIRECEESGWTGTTLMAANLPPPKWAIPELLVEGLNSLGGRPKKGKTILGMQMAKAKCGGGTILGRKAEKGKVLLIQRELGDRRLRKRLQQQGWTKKELTNLTIRTKWPPWKKGGREHLLQQIEDGGYALVIVDTLSKLVGKEVDLMDAGDVMVLYDELQAAAQKSNVAVLVVVHHRKRTAELPSDVVEDISGSTSASAGCEHLLGLYRFTGNPRASLAVVGYDLGDEKLALILEGPVEGKLEPPLLWHLDKSGISADVGSTIRGANEAILDALRDHDEGPMTSLEISQVIGKPARYVSNRLLRLRQTGHVEVVGKRDRAALYGLRSSPPLPQKRGDE